MAFLVSILAACGNFSEDQVLKVLEEKFGTLFEVSFNNENNRFVLRIIDEEIKTQTRLLLDSESNTEEILEYLQSTIIEISEGVSELLGQGYEIYLNYIDGTRNLRLLAASDGELIYTNPDLFTVNKDSSEEENEYEQINFAHRLGVTSEEVFKLLNKDGNFDWLRYSNWGNGFRIATTKHRYDPIRFVGLYEPTNRYLSTVGFVVPEDENKTEEENIDYWLDFLKSSGYLHSFLSLIDPVILQQMIEGVEVDSYALSIGNFMRDGYRVFMYRFEDTSLERDLFPLVLEEIFEADFFANEERMPEYRRLYRSGDYLGIYDLVNTYIKEAEEINESDSAFTILEYLEPIMEVMDQVEIIYDSVDDSATIYYKGLTQISDHHNFIPHSSSRNNGVYFTVGFENSDWLHFNQVIITLENNQQLKFFSLNNTNQEVLSNGNVLEESKISLSHDQISLLQRSKPTGIRFTNAEGQFLDFDFTEEERNALEVLLVFQETNVFSDLLFHWQH